MSTVFVVKWYDYTPWMEYVSEFIQGIFSSKTAAEEYIKSKGYKETDDKDKWLIGKDRGLVDVSIDYELRDEEENTIYVMNIEEWTVHD